MLNVTPMEIVHYVPNLVVLVDSSNANEGSLEDGSKLLNPLFGGNTKVSVERVGNEPRPSHCRGS